MCAWITHDFGNWKFHQIYVSELIRNEIPVVFHQLHWGTPDYSAYGLSQWKMLHCYVIFHWLSPYPNGPEAGREAGWGSEFVPLKKRQAESFILLHKISRTACCFGIRTFLKQYSCYESATNWYTDNQYLAQYSDIINNLQEIPLIFCNYAVRSCGTWRKGPGQSPCNGLSISDLELYVTETSTGVCDPVTD